MKKEVGYFEETLTTAFINTSTHAAKIKSTPVLVKLKLKMKNKKEKMHKL